MDSGPDDSNDDGAFKCRFVGHERAESYRTHRPDHQRPGERVVSIRIAGFQPGDYPALAIFLHRGPSPSLNFGDSGVGGRS